MPGLSFLRKYGTVAASQDNARKALQAGAAVLVYPGGDYEVHRPSWEGRRVDFGGRKGFLALALERGRADRARRLDRRAGDRAVPLARRAPGQAARRSTALFRLKVLPISLGLAVGPQHRRHARPPAAAGQDHRRGAAGRSTCAREFGADPDIDEVYDHLVRLMQETLDALAAERRFPVIG